MNLKTIHPFRRTLVTAGLTALASLALGPAMAQNYPAKPVRLVVTFPTGGAPDTLARIFSEKAQLGQAVVVDNKPGAGGNIGSDYVAKSTPDGYTIVMGTVGTHSINGTLYKKMPYDMTRDFAPISLIANAPNLLVVNNDLPVKTVPELVQYMKANPNKLSFGSPGVGTSVHVSGELFKSMTGTQMTHAPYKGRQFAIPDLIGGSIQLMFDNMPSALPMAKEGKIRAIAVTTTTRSEALPNVPPLAETVPGYEASATTGVAVPKGTPREVVDLLNKTMNAAYADPAMRARFADTGGAVLAVSPEEFAKIMVGETEKWGAVVKASGAKAE